MFTLLAVLRKSAPVLAHEVAATALADLIVHAVLFKIAEHLSAILF